jgi:branched-chain amino acid transport system ATP-binding protein
VANVLEVKDLIKDFGGFRAVDGVDLTVEKGTIHSLIGPNGAGKTTLFYLIAGYLSPTTGSIRFNGREVGGAKPHIVARRGIVCAFQITHVFPRLTVLDCVKSALVASAGHQLQFWKPIGNSLNARAMALLEEVGLADVADQKAQTLSHGDQRVLEVSLALATAPQMLLLDEPTAGMSPVETTRIMELVQRMVKQRGLTVLLVEHDVGVVFSISDRITVLHQGKVLAEGAAEDVRKDQNVIDVYLGNPSDAPAHQH